MSQASDENSRTLTVDTLSFLADEDWWKSIIEHFKLSISELKTPEVDVDERLIWLVKENPILYDKQCEFYENKTKSRKVWVRIAKSLELDVATTRVRWQELIDRFTKEYKYKDFPPLEGTVGDGQNAAFKHFDKMQWFVRHLRLSPDGETTNNTAKIASSEAFWTALESSAPSDDPPVEEKRTMVATGANKSDHHFMLSVMEDLRSLSPRAKFQFKKGVLELLEKCVSPEK